jgi:hypothetical protein
MNRSDSCLNRLFRAAARAEQSLPAEAPFWLETQVIAAWRQGIAAEPALLILPLIRRAFLCACAIVVASAAFTIHSLREPPPSELVFVDSAIQWNLLQ